MALGREAAVGAGPPAGIGAVEDGQMLGPDVRRAFQRHRTAAIEGGRLDLARAETQSAEQIEARPVEVAGIEAERAGAEVDTERPLVEREVQVEGGIEGASTRAMTADVKPLRASAAWSIAGAPLRVPLPTA